VFPEQTVDPEDPPPVQIAEPDPPPATAGPDAWAAAGNVSSVREGVAVALADGGAIFIGGKQKLSRASASVDRYDAGSNSWTAAEPMADTRFEFAAVTLPDGRVLAFGGSTHEDGPIGRNSAEIFDPATGSWSAAGKTIQRRWDHSAVVLADGRVLAVGGHDANTWDPGAELYNPSTNRWRKTGPGSRTRGEAAVTRMRDGRVFAAGFGGPMMNVSLADIYSPEADRWTPAAEPLVRREGATAVTLADGRVLVTGGYRWDAPSGKHLGLSSAETYDPATNSWTRTPDTHVPHGQGSRAVRLSDGSALVIGGTTVGDDSTAVAERFDPATNTWTPLGSLSRGRAFHGTVRLTDGSVLAISGKDAGTWAERLVPTVGPPVAELDPDPEMGTDPPDDPPIVVHPPIDVPIDPALEDPRIDRASAEPPALTAPKARPVAAGRARILTKRLRSRAVEVKVRCTGGPCQDRLVLRRGGKVLAARAFSARAGQTVTVALKLRGRAPRTATTVRVELTRQKVSVSASLRR
jgi:hypothetical protein